ncbi:hypothetical protein CU098_006449, partial [Rhizopus stolonifer]
MGDVHGVKREKLTEELLIARKEKDAIRIKEYNALTQACQQKMFNHEHDQEAFKLTTCIVSWTPDYYTAWNYRRTILMTTILGEDKDSNQNVLKEELLLLLQLIRSNPKSYWLWNHRFWCLQKMPKPNWHAELILVDKMLTMDARNFHGWDYRRYVIDHLRQEESNVYRLAESEYQFTTKKINQSFSNYSAWHQRSKLLPEIVAPMTTEEKNEIAKSELSLVKNAIYTDPEDQSAWLYYWWLMGNVSDKVELIGAYCLKDTRFIVLAFNDNVRLTQQPQVLNHKGEVLEGSLYPLPENARRPDRASLWIYSSEQDASKVVITSESVLPSSSSKLCHTTSWNKKVEQIDRGSETSDRLKKKLQENNIWIPSSARIYQDPTLNDQTEWFTLNRSQLLKEEINTVRELLKVEPESAWALQTLIHFLGQLILRADDVDKNKIYAEIISMLDLLLDLDNDRKDRYKEQRELFLFEQITKETWNLTKVIPDVLDISSVTRIPLLSKLLLVPKIIVSSDETKAIVTRLPFLNE